MVSPAIAEAAERLGERVLAMRAWQIHLKAHDAPEGWRALGRMHAEAGDRTRTEACFRRAGEVMHEHVSPDARPG